MFWTRTTAGKAAPLQADPATREPASITVDETRGRVQLVRIDQDLTGGETWIVRMLGEADIPDPDRPVWRSHFADCPHANTWRKR